MEAATESVACVWKVNLMPFVAEAIASILCRYSSTLHFYYSSKFAYSVSSQVSILMAWSGVNITVIDSCSAHHSNEQCVSDFRIFVRVRHFPFSDV